MSRNKREGHYYGKARGRYIRCDRMGRVCYGVSSWLAYRVYASRYL